MFGLEYFVMAELEKRKSQLKLIYLAGPYTHRLNKVMDDRQQKLTKAAVKLIN